MNHEFSRHCRTCGHFYFSTNWGDPCPCCKEMEELHPELPNYVKRCVDTAVDKMQEKVERRLDDLERATRNL